MTTPTSPPEKRLRARPSVFCPEASRIGLAGVIIPKQGATLVRLISGGGIYQCDVSSDPRMRVQYLAENATAYQIFERRH